MLSSFIYNFTGKMIKEVLHCQLSVLFGCRINSLAIKVKLIVILNISIEYFT